MLYVDLKYISLVSPYLRNFKQKNKTLFNFSCPICGDSEKKKNKARGFFYQHGPAMFYKCHNCSAGMGVSTFLKTCFPSYHDEYVFERYKEGENKKTVQNVLIAKTQVALSRFVSTTATKLSELSDEHYAKKYVQGRHLPPSSYNRLYFTEDFAKTVEELFPGKYNNLKPQDARLIIPFFNEKKELIGLQGRSFESDKYLRYITIRANSSIDLLYGKDCIDVTQIIYVVEGPLDSLFLPNCVAAANSDLCSASTKLPSQNVVLIYDNEPKNQEIVKLLEKSIDAGKSVCIWPKQITQKDINEIILSGTPPDQLLNIINQRTYSGLRAKLEFSQWKKI